MGWLKSWMLGRADVPEVQSQEEMEEVDYGQFRKISDAKSIILHQRI